jgi:hypothetical protein
LQLDENIYLAAFHVPQHLFFSTLDELVSTKYFEEEVWSSIHKDFRCVFLFELNLKSPLLIRHGLAQQVIYE